MKSYDFRGKTVLITGGSMGIGEAFARELARRGAKLLLVARSRERLQALQRELPGTEIVELDLSQREAPQQLFQEVIARGLQVDVLINNAGFGAFGAFSNLPLGLQLEEIDLNVHALVALTHLFLPMVERRQGGVIQVASTAAFQPLPYFAVYAATKAFVLNFSEALWAEYASRGVRILTLCPGATRTEFFKRAEDAPDFGHQAEPAEVVLLGLLAFERQRPSVVHGLGNWLRSLAPRFFTRKRALRIISRFMRSMVRPELLAPRSPAV